MEYEKPLIDDTFKPIFLLNEEIKEKPKSKLTNLLQKRIDVEMGKSLNASGSEFIEKVVEFKGKLAVPLKQGIVEYFQSHSEENELKPEVIKLFSSFKEDAKDRERLQFQTVLGLLGHGQFHQQDCSILGRWLNGAAKKEVSGKFANLFCGRQVCLIVSLLDHCKEILILLQEDDFQKIKKHTSDAILAIPINDDRERNLRSFKTLEKIIESKYWVPSVKDQMIFSNLENYKKKSDNGLIETQNVVAGLNGKVSETHRNISQPQKTIAKSEEKKVQSGEEFLNDSERKPADNKANSHGIERIDLGDYEDSASNEKNVVCDELNSTQQGAIRNLAKVFRSANKEVAKLGSTLQKTMKELDFLKKKHEGDIAEIAIISKENNENEKLLFELKERLSRNREDHERKASEWKRLSSEMEGKISKVEIELRQVKEILAKKEFELDRERKLSHATHSDAVNRSAVELETKMGAISKSVSPIFKEVDEFWEIEDLHPKARMLLNICRKVKHALQANGVKL